MKIDQNSRMKPHRVRRPLTFGDFVAGVYGAWGKREAKGIIQLAVNGHVIEFLGPKRFVIS
jgi:hypothetical protein